jgi:hypothetical protein
MKKRTGKDCCGGGEKVLEGTRGGFRTLPSLITADPLDASRSQTESKKKIKITCEVRIACALLLSIRDMWVDRENERVFVVGNEK